MASRLEAEVKAEKVTLGVVTDLHGNIDMFVFKRLLKGLSPFGTLPGRSFPEVLEKYSRIRGIKAYVPWLTATYVMIINKKAFKYLPLGLSESNVLESTDKWTYDALLRVMIRSELRKLQRRIIYVTHDQVETMTMADHIAVKKEGGIMQVGTPDEIIQQAGKPLRSELHRQPEDELLRRIRRGDGGRDAARHRRLQGGA